jgi:adenylate cyclase
MTEGTKRRLAAIVSADVVGYSRLMGADEQGTLAAMRAHRSELIDPKIAEHGGRIVKTMGDGLLLEFPSVVDATQCSIEVQQGTAERNRDIDNDWRIVFRVGINLGDIVVDGDDILGDGVNIAARLQEIAEPGGICLSDTAFQQVNGKVDAQFTDGGEVTLKNIAGPVRVLRWSPRDGVPVSISDVSQPVPGFDGRPAIAVLAFENLSHDPEQEFLADGIAEDILTRLAMWRWLPVIARNSSFTYKGQAVDVKKVGLDLGARYVLEGSLRRAGNRVRVTGQLIDTETGHHVWAERYERRMDDIFALQDEITEAVVAALEPAVGRAEMQRAQRRTPTDLNAWDLYQRGMSEMTKATRDRLKSARELFQRSARRDPNFAPPLASHAVADFIDNTLGFSTNVEEMVAAAETAAQLAVSLDDLEPLAHAGLALASFMSGKHQTAVAAGRRAVELNPSFALGHHALAAALYGSGMHDEAIDIARKAIRISPNDPCLFLFLGVLSASLYMRHDYSDAVETAGHAIERFPWYASTVRWQMMALAQLNRDDESQGLLSKFLKLAPQYNLRVAKHSYAFQRQVDLDHFLDGLRKAGLPE